MVLLASVSSCVGGGGYIVLIDSIDKYRAKQREPSARSASDHCDWPSYLPTTIFFSTVIYFLIRLNLQQNFPTSPLRASSNSCVSSACSFFPTTTQMCIFFVSRKKRCSTPVFCICLFVSKFAFDVGLRLFFSSFNYNNISVFCLSYGQCYGRFLVDVCEWVLSVFVCMRVIQQLCVCVFEKGRDKKTKEKTPEWRKKRTDENSCSPLVVFIGIYVGKSQNSSRQFGLMWVSMVYQKTKFNAEESYQSKQTKQAELILTWTVFRKFQNC